MSGHEWLNELGQIFDAHGVSTDEDVLAAHSYDWWPISTKWKKQGKRPYQANAVVYPRTPEQISLLAKWATERNVALTPWGAGSAVTGAGLSVNGGVMIDMSEMERVLALDENSLRVRVEAGIMGHRLEELLNEQGYTLNHSPQSLDRSTVGGWISTRATGQFSSRWGGIEDLVLGFTVVLPTGEIVTLDYGPRASTGPDLRHVFMGAEGTMGIVTDVTLRIFPVATHRIFEAIAFGTVDAGLAAIRIVMRLGLKPFLVRFYDEAEARHAMVDENYHGCVLFLGFEGLNTVAEAEYEAGIKICLAEGGKLIGPEPVIAWMARRFDFSTIERVLDQPGGVAETIEVGQFWDHMAATYYALKTALTPYATEVLGHFSHVYTHGTSLYMILLGQVEDDAAAEERLMRIWETAMEVCLSKGAVISHHHGIGLARQPFIRDYLGASAEVLDKIKSAMDPAGIMNPGKLGLVQLTPKTVHPAEDTSA